MFNNSRAYVAPYINWNCDTELWKWTFSRLSIEDNVNKTICSIKDMQVNVYFSIWFGLTNAINDQVFNVKIRFVCKGKISLKFFAKRFQKWINKVFFYIFYNTKWLIENYFRSEKIFQKHPRFLKIPSLETYYRMCFQDLIRFLYTKY